MFTYNSRTLRILGKVWKFINFNDESDPILTQAIT